jgi:hypothetical protein
MFRVPAFIVFASCLFFMSCSKPTKSKTDDDRLDRPYCNDPEAINYNWDFPGKPDNSKCFYPSGVFGGSYILNDTVLDEDFAVDTVYAERPISIFGINGSHIHLGLLGLCSSGDTIKVTADRFFKAMVDSSVASLGQFYCGSETDTLVGLFSKQKNNDTLLFIDFTIYSDSGKVFYHKSTAKKQY